MPVRVMHYQSCENSNDKSPNSVPSTLLQVTAHILIHEIVMEGNVPGSWHLTKASIYRVIFTPGPLWPFHGNV